MRVLVERVAVNAAQSLGTKRARTTPTKPTDADPIASEWRVLESGVLATPTSIEVLTENGMRRVWCDPRGGGSETFVTGTRAADPHFLRSGTALLLAKVTAR